MPEQQIHSLTIYPVPPFDFALTASYAVYFRGRYGTGVFDNGIFHRLLDLNGALCLISITSQGTIDSPALTLEITGNRLDTKTIEQSSNVATKLLGAGENLRPFYQMAEKDASLALLIRGLYGLHLPQTASVFEALVLAILGQQISAAVAMKLRSSLIQTYGKSIEVEDAVYHAFPYPEALAAAGIEKLRAIGLSQRKAEYISDISRRIVSDELDLEGLLQLSDEAAIAKLTEIRGVGEWTANWLLIRALGRPDGFPASDSALMRFVRRLADKEDMSPAEVEAYSRRWSPFRSFVTGYLFAAARSGRMELIEPNRTA